jgi:signal transduction histidine kinase
MGNFCANKGIQILASGTHREWWLFDSDFSPLAYLPEGGELEILRSGQDQVAFLMHRGGATYVHVLERNPWYRGFFIKYRIHITGIVGALTATLAMVVFHQRKTTRNLLIIKRQKDKLEDLNAQLHMAQQQIVAQEKYRQAQDIAGGVAHEIHNALCPAINSLEILHNRLGRARDSDAKRDRDLIGLTKAAVARGLQMTELVTAYSRLDLEKESQRVNLKQLLEEVVGANRRQLDGLGVRLNLDISEDCTITCNKTHAFSLFNNLMINSVDAVADIAHRAIDVAAHHHQGKVIVRFADTGRGIPPDSVARIFDVFYSTKPSAGAGLGLSMAKKVVELYGGTIEVESILDKGTTFTIILSRT